MDVCGRDAIYMPMEGVFEGRPLFIPDTTCGDCSQYESRIARIEALLDGLGRVNMSKKDTDGRTTTTTFIGRTG